MNPNFDHFNAKCRVEYSEFLKNHENTVENIESFLNVDICFLRIENGRITCFESEPKISRKTVFIHRRSRTGKSDTVGLAEIPKSVLVEGLKKRGKFYCDTLLTLTNLLNLPNPNLEFSMDNIFELQDRLKVNFTISDSNSPGSPKFKVAKKYEGAGDKLF